MYTVVLLVALNSIVRRARSKDDILGLLTVTELRYFDDEAIPRDGSVGCVIEVLSGQAARCLRRFEDIGCKDDEIEAQSRHL